MRRVASRAVAAGVQQPRAFRVVEREPGTPLRGAGGPVESAASIAARIAAARRAKYTRLGGTMAGGPGGPAQHSVFRDATPAVDESDSRKAHNARMAEAAAAAGPKGDPFSPPRLDARLERAARAARGREPLIPADMYEDPTPTRRGPRGRDGADGPLPPHEREARMREALGAAASYVEVQRGGEDDIDTGGAPPEVFHTSGRDAASGVVIAADSPLNMNVLSKDPRMDRSRSENTWSLLRRAASTSATKQDEIKDKGPTGPPPPQGSYDTAFPDGANLEHEPERLQYSVSTYTRTRLVMDGVTGYLGAVTESEELDVCAELLRLLGHRCAKFIAQEGRYCVNLVENLTGLGTREGPLDDSAENDITKGRLGLPDRDPLAFSLPHDAPVLRQILSRAFQLGQLPAMPNVVQVNELVGPHSGYPPHRKHPSLGPYFAVLNFVSPVVLQMLHVDQPWRPSIMVPARGMYVFERPALDEYAVGSSRVGDVWRRFRISSRHVRDYRIEVVCATVDVPQTPLLADAVALTRRAAKRPQAFSPQPDLAVAANRRVETTSDVDTRRARAALAGGIDGTAQAAEKLASGLHSSGDMRLLKQMLEQSRGTRPRPL